MKLLKYGDERLSEVSEQLTFPLSEIEVSEINNLAEFLKNETPRAQGLSAIQVGIKKRVAALNVNGKRFIIINPKILKTTGTQWSDESCLSVDKTALAHDYYKLRRPTSIVVEYYDIEGVRHEEKIGRKECRVYCHEIDHMNGRLINMVGKYYCSEKIKGERRGI